MSVEMSDEAKLMKFVNEGSAIQCSWENEMCLIWVNHSMLGYFVELFPHIFETENEVMANIQIDCVCLDLTTVFDEVMLEAMVPKE